MEKIAWVEYEYEERERNIDWFWALGVIVVAGSAAALIFGNYFFALLILISGILLAIFAIKKPEIIPYELNEKGFQIKTRMYPYQDIKSFWVQKEGKPLLFLHSKRLIMPVLSIPYQINQADRIRNLLLEKNIPEIEMKEHASIKIMETLGF